MSSYTAANPALTATYDKQRSDNARETAAAPKQRPGEPDSDYRDRLSQYLAVVRAFDSVERK